MKRVDTVRTNKRQRPSKNKGQNSSSENPQLEVKEFPFKKVAIRDKRKPCETCNHVHLREHKWKTKAYFKWDTKLEIVLTLYQ